MSTAASHSQCLAKFNPLGQPLPSSAQRKLTFGKKRIPLRRRVALHHVLQIQSKAGVGRGTVKIKEEEEIDVEPEPEPSTGTKKFPRLPGTIKLPGPAKSQAKGQSQAKSNKVVFVAGATGKVGSRTVRELLKLGFQVRAGTRNTEKAQALFEDVLQRGPSATGSNDAALFGFFSPAKLFGFLKPKAGKGLEFVECDLEDVESIESALGNAGAVVCCIGASEKEVLDVSGPYRIDFKATVNLITAASSAQVDHFVLVTSLGTQKFGFPAAVLNLFWGVLVWKAKAEKALFQSGLPYTIVRPGGMERPTDDYKETHNLILSEADKLFGGQVSRLQVAELLASIIENPEVSVNKVIEAIAETTAPLRPIRELLEEIPSKDDPVSSTKPQSPRKSRSAKADVAPEKVSKKQEEEKLAEERRTLALREKEEKQKKLAEEKLARDEKEKEEKRIRADNDEKERLRLQALRKKYEQEIEAAREKEEAANSTAAAAVAEKTELEKRVAEVRAKAEAAALAASQAKAVEAAVLASAQQGNVLSDAEKEKIKESVRLARRPKEDSPKEAKKPSPKKKSAFSFFGKVAPSTETDTGVGSGSEEDQAKVDAESKAKAKSGKEADAKLAGQKKQEEKARKEEEAKKLTEQENTKALEAKKKAEQDKAEKEAKVKAEKEAAEAKKKEEAEAKRKEEEEEAERLKVEAEEKAKAEAKRKEEAEAKRKEEEAEAKRKEEEAAQAERLKVEAEEKAKAEQEAEGKRKEEELAEAKKKEEQEKAETETERPRVAAEEKAKALAEQAATAAAAAAAEVEKKGEELKKAVEAPAAPRGNAFRWFLQLGKPDAVEEQQITSGGESAQEKLTTGAGVTAQAKVSEQLPPSPTPLSPYTRYPELKPPYPPLASTSTGKVDTPKVNKVDTPKVDKDDAPKVNKVDTPKVDLVSPTINKVEQIKEEVEVLAEKGKEVVTEEVAPESQEDIEARSKLAEETAAREKEALEKAEAAVSLKWLWEKTDPVKETTTSTSSKKEDSVSSFKKEDSVSSSKDEEPVSSATSKSDDLPRSSRPLSPYAQFPNLKPPAPPLPSPPAISNLVEEVKESEPFSASSTPLSPYPGFPDLKPPPSPTPLYNEAGNGAVPEDAEENQEIKVESTRSSGFKWPWQG